MDFSLVLETKVLNPCCFLFVEIVVQLLSSSLESVPDTPYSCQERDYSAFCVNLFVMLRHTPPTTLRKQGKTVPHLVGLPGQEKGEHLCKEWVGFIPRKGFE